MPTMMTQLPTASDQSSSEDSDTETPVQLFNGIAVGKVLVVTALFWALPQPQAHVLYLFSPSPPRWPPLCMPLTYLLHYYLRQVLELERDTGVHVTTSHGSSATATAMYLPIFLHDMMCSPSQILPILFNLLHVAMLARSDSCMPSG